MATLNAYLMFNGDCREAMEFYKGCFGGELQLMTYGSSPMGAQTSELKDKIMHFYLKSGNISFMGSDMLQGEPPKHGNRVILCLVCDSKEEIEALFAKVSAGGKINRALKEEFFGTYGEAADKFGFYWMFQYSPQKM